MGAGTAKATTKKTDREIQAERLQQAQDRLDAIPAEIDSLMDAMEAAISDGNDTLAEKLQEELSKVEREQQRRQMQLEAATKKLNEFAKQDALEQIAAIVAEHKKICGKNEKLKHEIEELYLELVTKISSRLALFNQSRNITQDIDRLCKETHTHAPTLSDLSLTPEERAIFVNGAEGQTFITIVNAHLSAF